MISASFFLNQMMFFIVRNGFVSLRFVVLEYNNGQVCEGDAAWSLSAVTLVCFPPVLNFKQLKLLLRSLHRL